ncbi:uncharacterized membrane protein YhaH (DUF805 family) [Marinobacter oulmenensis]|uniref:Uncharacterized membrane protein YhaH (DUF805 family) n=1 Tax=Marinobacter oulmenensis TaxID=643747 RepID=A0A840UH97_9GAMM|nr:uncharacterized membrane protein YhaH (DUF805 family) [Marinobacter oulmenensis]
MALKLIGLLLGTDFLSFLFGLVIFVPSISYATRRLHDVGKSGWWQLILIVPVIGLIVLVVFLAQDSEKGENAYGVSPKYP